MGTDYDLGEERARMQQPGRLTDLVHHVIARSRPGDLGATKLNKVLWYADITQYRRTGRTISGALHYTKLKYGPAPNGIQQTLEFLKARGIVEEKIVATPVGERREYKSLQAPPENIFDDAEAGVVAEIVDWIAKDHSAASISRLSTMRTGRKSNSADRCRSGLPPCTLWMPTNKM